ncbi:uncharacterized protein EV420DRAFT_385963 [Desarmillaria tabescens]|uniref:ABC transmembrane type-1 domain-containing protein n=1 Tax=Armillaria tabescens TaxID=1929756 RepID=A0AA39KBR4_ARMTA|nr:uncharacterized protein EV420DRAFT_385963 [Desarmillaria tabescens]KAK0458234.1 hypothetical protein EV420DRAFT_385963 [Desarmillaria tabescens]
MLSTSSMSGSLTLQAAGLVALADLSVVAQRTALMGTASYLDILVLAPGMHQQQSADEVNRGEYPMTGSMTKGNVFRVENPATVRYLQNISRTGCLVTAEVSLKPPSHKSLIIPLWDKDLSPFYFAGARAAVLYFLCPVLAVIVFTLLGAIRDWWGLAVLVTLVFARWINVVVIKRRSREDWKGAKEEGRDDLFVLLSQDRWVRLQGTINDLKTATAGQWLREPHSGESFAVGLATLLVYSSAALAGNASTVGSLLIACLLLCTVALLALCNSSTRCLQMYDCVVREAEGSLKEYPRRMEMVKYLIHETRRSDWALGMELITSDERAKIVKSMPPSNEPTDRPLSMHPSLPLSSHVDRNSL